MALESVAFERFDGGVEETSALHDDFDALYRRYYPRLVSTCRRRVGDDTLAEDIAQETLIRALTHRDAFDRGRPAWPWLKTIATNLIVDHYRKQVRETALNTQDVDAIEDGPSVEEADLLRRAIQKLPRRQRAAVALRYLNDWDAQDAASFMGVTRPAYEQLLFRARRRLKMEYRRLSQEVSAGVALSSSVMRAWGRRASDRMRELSSHAHPVADLTSVTCAQLASGAIAFAIVMGGQPVTQAPPAPPAAAGAPVAVVARGHDKTYGGSLQRGGPAATAFGYGKVSSPAVATDSENAHTTAGRNPLGEMTTDEVTQPEDVRITSISLTSSSNGRDFAVGRGDCTADVCPSVLFESRDQGATWSRLPAEAFNSETVLVPPGAGADDPIFGMGRVGLQVSRDGGATFTPAAPTSAPYAVGSGAISPAFNSGDPTILIGAQTLMRYRDDLGVVEPAPWMTGAGPLRPAFSPRYPADDRLVVGGMVPNSGSGGLTSAVYACAAMVCSSTTIGTMALSVHVRLAPDFATGNTVYAFTARAVFVSNDGAASFASVGVPWSDAIIDDVAVGESGRLFAAVHGKEPGLFSSADGGSTWTEISNELLADGASSISLTGDRVVVALRGKGLACSQDAGVTWNTRCAPVS